MVNYKLQNNQCFDVLIKYTPTIASTIPPNNRKLNFSFKKTIPNINVKTTISGSMVGMTMDKESLLRSKYKNAEPITLHSAIKKEYMIDSLLIESMNSSLLNIIVRINNMILPTIYLCMIRLI